MAAPPASHADTCIREPDETTQPNHHAERIETNGIHALGNGIINSGLDSPRATHDTQRLSPDNQDDDFAALEGITEAWWTTGAHVISAHLIEDVDENVKAPEIQTELEGESASYFIKVTDYRSGAVMYQSEFESLKAIDQAVPGFCPKPIGWGRYAADPAVHFLLCSFIEMIDEPPDQVLLPQRLAELHQKAVAPDLKYGWHVPMASGQLPLTLAKSHSWEFIFTQYMRFLFRAEEIAQGPRPKVMERLVTALFDRIIPRLVRPLETGGRDIIPRLLHTDFWDGNVSVDEQGLPVTFDPCSMYGHNEFDIGVWLNPRVVTGLPFINSYHDFFAHSAPEEDHVKRNILYSLAFEARVSATIVGNRLFRDEVIRYMVDLDDMVPESYEDWAHARGEEACQPKWKLASS